MHLKMSPVKWQPFCLGLNVLTGWWNWTPAPDPRPGFLECFLVIHQYMVYSPSHEDDIRDPPEMGITQLGPNLLTDYPTKFKFNGNLSISCLSNSDRVITSKFCTCHDSRAVVACAKICSDLMSRNRIKANISHQIWTMHEKSLELWPRGLTANHDILLCHKSWMTALPWMDQQLDLTIYMWDAFKEIHVSFFLCFFPQLQNSPVHRSIVRFNHSHVKCF